MSKLTVERLKELAIYDPATGVFTRRVQVRKHKAGTRIGCVNKALGYEMAQIDGFKCYLHRVAFLYMTGAWPEEHIDHINGDRSDNRWVNLRAVSQSVNNQNSRHARSHSKSGLLGVKTCSYGFAAQIAVNKKHIHLGTFRTAELAHAAYLDAKRELHAGCTI